MTETCHDSIHNPKDAINLIFSISLIFAGALGNILIEPSDDVDPRLYHLDNQGHLIFPLMKELFLTGVLKLS